MKVERVTTERGSRIEPPCEDHWNDFKKLAWKAAVTSLEAGFRVEIFIHTRARWWRLRPSVTYSALTPHHSLGGDFHTIWSILNGIAVGAQEGHRLEDAWDDGFTSCAYEHLAQERDPSHPITRTNPYRSQA